MESEPFVSRYRCGIDSLKGDGFFLSTIEISSGVAEKTLSSPPISIRKERPVLQSAVKSRKQEFRVSFLSFMVGQGDGTGGGGCCLVEADGEELPGQAAALEDPLGPS